MSFGSFGTKNSMVTFFFNFDPRKGQLQVKLGQIRPNFKIIISLQNMPFCAVLCQDSKNIVYCYVRQLKMPKRAFQICDVITFTCFFFGHCTAKWPKIELYVCALKFCMRVVCMYLNHIYSVFLDKWKQLGL